MATIVRLPDLPVVPVENGDTVAAYRNGKVVRIPAGGGGGDLPDLATVAFTGMYSDLLGLPTLGSAASMSASAFATAAQGALADSSLQPADIGATIQAYSAILSGTTASFTTALKTKLDDIQAGATANATDSYLLNRANHTGTQPASTITGLATVATTGSYNDLTDKPTISSGTVTSVNVSVPTGLQASGGPVTSSGTIAISYASGYAIPTTEKQSQWDTAYGWGNHALAGYVTTAAMHAYTYDKATIDSKIDAGGGGEETYPYRGVLTTEDLNDVRESGVYGQPSTPNATLARNYPANIAGALEVLVLNAATTPYPIVTQRYTTNEGTQRIFIRRGGAQGGWNAWREIAIGVGTNAYVNQYISTNPPSGTSPGDVWYQVES